MALSLMLVAGLAGPVSAHGASAGDLPVVPESFRLKHLKPAEVVALFGRETLPEGSGPGPRAARVDSPDALLPAGVQAVMRTGDAATVVLVGSEDRFLEMQECLEVLDEPVEQVSPDRKRMVLKLRHADPRALRSVLRKLSGSGSAVINGSKLTLEGTSEWLHRALRQVIRAELGQIPSAERFLP